MSDVSPVRAKNATHDGLVAARLTHDEISLEWGTDVPDVNELAGKKGRMLCPCGQHRFPVDRRQRSIDS